MTFKYLLGNVRAPNGADLRRAGGEVFRFHISEPEDNEFVKDIEKLINQRIRVIRDNPFPQTEESMNAKGKDRNSKRKRKIERSRNSLGCLEIKKRSRQQGRDGRNDRKRVGN